MKARFPAVMNATSFESTGVALAVEDHDLDVLHRVAGDDAAGQGLAHALLHRGDVLTSGWCRRRPRCGTRNPPRARGAPRAGRPRRTGRRRPSASCGGGDPRRSSSPFRRYAIRGGRVATSILNRCRRRSSAMRRWRSPRPRSTASCSSRSCSKVRQGSSSIKRAMDAASFWSSLRVRGRDAPGRRAARAGSGARGGCSPRRGSRAAPHPGAARRSWPARRSRRGRPPRPRSGPCRGSWYRWAILMGLRRVADEELRVLAQHALVHPQRRRVCPGRGPRSRGTHGRPRAARRRS
jgi:hypothetical protein